MKESRKKLIKELHSSACLGRQKDIEREFPNLFESEYLEEGVWYRFKSEPKYLACLLDGNRFGFDTDGKWFHVTDKYKYSIKEGYYKATDQEVKEALIKEAEKRGFVEGVRYIAVGEECGMNKLLDDVDFRYGIGQVDALCSSGLPRVYYKGKWAEIVEQTYSIGQRFEFDGEEYILCVLSKTVGFIDFKNGCRWCEGVEVKNIFKITQSELDELIRGFDFKLIK